MLIEDLAALSYFPRVSLRDGRVRVQRSNNWEIGYRKKLGSRTFSAAVYRERISNAALNMQAPAGGVFDPGRTVAGSGLFRLHLHFQRGSLQKPRLHGDPQPAPRRQSERLIVLWQGRALTTGEGAVRVRTAEDLRKKVETTQRNWASTRVAGVLPACGTRFDASYQWSDARTLNPVHAYITQGMVPMSGLNISFRQPIPAPWLMPGRFEATRGTRNLLSQGYLPITTSDDRKVMLMHSPRSVRGGFSFIF